MVDATQATAMNSPARTPSAQARSRRRLNVAPLAPQARPGVLSLETLELLSLGRSTGPLLPPSQVIGDPPATVTAKLVPALEDAPPILSQEERFRTPLGGRGSRRGGNPRGPRRWHRKNPTGSPQGHGRSLPGAQLQNASKGGSDTEALVDVPQGRGRGSTGQRGAARASEEEGFPDRVQEEGGHLCAAAAVEVDTKYQDRHP
jgi:hypothetical protein